MKEIFEKSVPENIIFYFSIDYNVNQSDNEIVETRTIKRELEVSNSVQYIKSSMLRYPLKEADAGLVQLLESNSRYYRISEKITFDQFEKFLDDSCDLFAVDVTKLNLY